MKNPFLTERLNQFMKARNIKATDIAKSVGVSRAAVSGWCNGISEPTASHVFAMEKGFGVSAEWLVTGDGEMLTSSSKKLLSQIDRAEDEVKLAIWSLLGVSKAEAKKIAQIIKLTTSITKESV